MPNTSKKEQKLQVLSVFLDNQVFGIPVPQIQDVIDSLQLTRVPQAHGAIGGVANLRGRIVTAIDLRKRIKGSNAADPTGSMNIVLESGHELYSILVDRVGDVLTIDRSEVEDPPMTMDADWREVVDCVHQLDNSIIVILDTDKILHIH